MIFLIPVLHTSLYHIPHILRRKRENSCWPGSHLKHKAERHCQPHNWSLALTMRRRPTPCPEHWCQGATVFPGALPQSSPHFFTSPLPRRAPCFIGCSQWCSGIGSPMFLIFLSAPTTYPILFSVPHHMCMLGVIYLSNHRKGSQSTWILLLCYEEMSVHHGELEWRFTWGTGLLWDCRYSANTLGYGFVCQHSPGCVSLFI